MLRFTYQLTGRGWSAATISDRDASAELTASYLSDALGDLARAAIRLLYGAEAATFSWAEEPGEYRWQVVRTDDRVSIRILWFDGLWSGRPDAEGQTVFETSCRLVDFAGQVTSQLRALLDDLGEAEYERRWARHTFPRAEYETLLKRPRE